MILLKQLSRLVYAIIELNVFILAKKIKKTNPTNLILLPMSEEKKSTFFIMTVLNSIIIQSPIHERKVRPLDWKCTSY